MALSVRYSTVEILNLLTASKYVVYRVLLLKTSTTAYQSKVTSKHPQKSKLSPNVFVRKTNSSFQLVKLVKCHCAAIWAVKKFPLFYNLKGEMKLRNYTVET